jgi:uncharacterized protein YbdZ (MbtH family)
MVYDPHLWPNRYVKVMCDFCAAPTWNADGHPEEPHSLPIPEELVGDLMAWWTLYNRQSTNLEDGEEDPHALPEGWHATGFQLACRLRLALPIGWTVVHHNEEDLWRSLQHADDTIAYQHTISMEMAQEAMDKAPTAFS